MDYSHNLYISNFGGEHPGSTYYFTPRILYQLGIVEFAKGCYILYYDLYQKGEVKKLGEIMWHV